MNDLTIQKNCFLLRVKVDYSEDIYELGFGNGFSTYGYCEFLGYNNEIISHKIVFSSGAIILIWLK